ncbi:hypothetical protein D3C71_2016860 [compost metagenome]
MKHSRLRKKADDGAGFPWMITYSPEEKVDNKDEITDTTYAPSISKEWEFEKPRDNSEWHVQSNMGKKQ